MSMAKRDIPVISGEKVKVASFIQFVTQNYINSIETTNVFPQQEGINKMGSVSKT